MASTTSSKRAKRLVNKLSELQYHDQELTGPICLSIKHDLRSSKYCKLAQVFSGPDTVLDIPVARGSARKFILSQLEAQKLTNQETSVVFFSPLIRYIVSCLPPVRGKWPPTAATIFTWHCFRTHRTFCIFAFVDCTTTMPSYKYTAQQLLELRAFGVPMSLEDAPQKGVDHGIQTGSAGRQSGSESRESLTLGRFHKYRPFHTQQSSTARSRIDFPGAPDEIVYVTRQPRREATTGNPAEMEWRYRGRVGSEATSAEPLSAPTGINAQQSEGFQRFYKAVISPTHVRVTAGGRIVPNTRGTSPMSKRPKDKGDEGDLAKDANPPPDDQTQRVPDGPYLAGPHPSNLPLYAFPPHHPFYPPFPAPMPRMSMMPLPLGLAMPGGFPFPPQPGPPGTTSRMLLPEAEKNFAKENVQNGNRREPSNFKTPTFDKTREHPMHLPSEQLDRTKPFIVNGQMVYPFAPPAVPPHIAVGPPSQIPSGFLGNPNFPLALFHGSLMTPSQAGMNHLFNSPLGFPSLPGPFQAPQANPTHPGQSAVTNAGSVPSSENAPQLPSAPPISSIRPSEISRKQIEMLRGSLKYHEDQLLYNKHQIDEKEMERTIRMLQSQIDRFEALNQNQLRFEENHYPKKEPIAAETNGPERRAIDRASRSSASMQGTVKHVSSSTRRSHSIRHKQVLRRKEPLFHLNPVDPSFALSDPIKKSTLPIKAALAPPFEPRSLAIAEAQAPRVRGSFQWDGASVDESSAVDQNNDGRAYGVRGPSHDKKPSVVTTNNKSDLSKPYLVGTLPAGIDPQHARDSDYVYERELTHDETRSRYLFWGRAPSFTRKGLPKFDGKDFYPPSPANDAIGDSPPPPLLGRHVPIGAPDVDYYTGAFQPEVTQASQAGNPGRYASEFRRERQKPVKVTLRRPDSDALEDRSQVNDKNPKGFEEAPKDVTQGGKQDTQANNTRSKLLHTVLKRNISTNSEVLPGALTSATVQGVLPQYSTGYDSLVAASLSSVHSSPVALGRLSPIKSDDGSSIFVTPASRRIGENRPPPESVGPTSLEQQFQKRMTLVESNHDVSPWDSL